MIKILNKRFGLGKHLSFQAGEGGLIKASIANAHADAEVYLHGAHLTHYQPRNERAVIWMSDTAVFSSDKAIRGGVPVCWPWFGAHPTNAEFPQHGFARLSEWSVYASEASPNGTTSISLVLNSDGGLDLWPQPFRLSMTFTLGKELTLSLTVQNIAPVTLEFGAALHSYFAIGDSHSIRITGLENCDYLDKPDNYALKKQFGDILIQGEVDRVYLGTQSDCVIYDPDLERRIVVSKQGSCSTIVWNPGQTSASKMPDFDDDGYLKMVCVETANAASDSRRIKPFESHTLVQRIAVL
jgi:glucose-6-phosphate 1-epimerase